MIGLAKGRRIGVYYHSLIFFLKINQVQYFHKNQITVLNLLFQSNVHVATLNKGDDDLIGSST